MTQWIVENLGPDVPVHFTAFSSRLEDAGQAAHPARDTVSGHEISHSKTVSVTRIRETFTIKKRKARTATTAANC